MPIVTSRDTTPPGSDQPVVVEERSVHTDTTQELLPATATVGVVWLAVETSVAEAKTGAAVPTPRYTAS